MTDPGFTAYWKWFLRGSGGRPGYLRFFDRWIFIHIAIGGLLAWIVPLPLSQCSNAVLLPLAGIIIGLAFAWAGNAQALLQTGEMERVADHHQGGFVEYVYVYQTAILIIMISLVTWSLAGMSVFDDRWPTPARACTYFISKASLFALSSIALRECWHVVLGAQWMLLTQREVKRSAVRANSEDPSPKDADGGNSADD